jgi:hypothetical protein
MITPVRSTTLDFTVDGTSTTFAVDLSTLPLGLNFTGQQPQGIQSLVVLGAASAVVTGVTATIAGSILRLTFMTAPPKLDGSSNLITYVATFLLQFLSYA